MNSAKEKKNTLTPDNLVLTYIWFVEKNKFFWKILTMLLLFRITPRKKRSGKALKENTRLKVDHSYISYLIFNWFFLFTIRIVMFYFFSKKMLLWTNFFWCVLSNFSNSVPYYYIYPLPKVMLSIAKCLMKNLAILPFV